VVVRHALEGGRRRGVAAAAGAALANTTHATLAAVGLSVIIARWPVLLQVVRALGAGYLLWLGGQSLGRAWREPDGGIRLDNPQPRRSPSARLVDAFRDGVAINMLSPVIISFYAAVVPTFIPAGAPRAYFALLAGLHIGMALTCHTLWALAFDALRQLLRAPEARRAVEACAGVALVTLAAWVLLR
jgi:threonine/homoserine/homoserine lactone efflux protein